MFICETSSARSRSSDALDWFLKALALKGHGFSRAVLGGHISVGFSR
jgi:hypothetical protein